MIIYEIYDFHLSGRVYRRNLKQAKREYDLIESGSLDRLTIRRPTNKDMFLNLLNQVEFVTDRKKLLSKGVN